MSTTKPKFAALRLGCAAIVGLAVATVSHPAHGEIVNIQAFLAEDAKPGVSGAITGTADWRTGNVSLLLLSLAPQLRYRSGKHLLVGIFKGELIDQGERLYRTFEHLRYRYQIRPAFGGESFVQHSFDELKRLRLRAVVGVGPYAALLDKKHLQIKLGTSYMLERDELQSGYRNQDGSTEEWAHRANFYATARYAIDKNLEAINTLYIQPRIDQAEDTRVLNETSLVVGVTDNLNVTSSFVVAYDSRPPIAIAPAVDDVAKTDTTVKISLTLSL